MFGLGVTEILVILVIALFLFGSSLPSVMRMLGKSFVEFKREANSLTEDLRHPLK